MNELTTETYFHSKTWWINRVIYWNNRLNECDWDNTTKRIYEHNLKISQMKVKGDKRGLPSGGKNIGIPTDNGEAMAKLKLDIYNRKVKKVVSQDDVSKLEADYEKALEKSRLYETRENKAQAVRASNRLSTARHRLVEDRV